jgi:two-component system, NtrC family, sensor kinase
MSTVKSKLAFLDSNPELVQKFAEYEPAILQASNIRDQSLDVDILVLSALDLQKSELIEVLSKKRKNSEIAKFILALDEAKKAEIQLEDYNRIQPDLVLKQTELDADVFLQLLEDINQSEQDESYLNLSSELNLQYEIIKEELEKKLVEKTKNLIESRKQIFEINNRFEFLRKTLYVTSKVSSIEQAEAELNTLLAQQNKITWLKIVKDAEAERFELDLGDEFSETFYKTPIKIDRTEYWIYFFKTDKKPFKKSDADYFKKLGETLQINLNRYANLLSLQQSERLFDLAFHSSPHYIMVIDQNYQVLQANLAIEKNIKDGAENLDGSDKSKCYEVLFGRTSPCIGCKLGENFQIHDGLKTLRVQSNSFNLNEDDENNYWIHLYEDISDQIALENKFQQTARLAELGLISSSIAHELNNPLGGIISYLQIMKMDLPSHHPFQQDIQLMNETAMRMKKIIEDLLIFSRKENTLQVEVVSIYEVLLKTMDLLQMQLKKENLKVSLKEPTEAIVHPLSVLHFRNSIHLVFQYFLQKLKLKKLTQSNYTGLVEVKIFQDQMSSYLAFSGNLGPYDAQANTNDMTLITLEKSLLDQGFQVVTSESMPGWIQVLITLSRQTPTKDGSR